MVLVSKLGAAISLHLALGSRAFALPDPGANALANNDRWVRALDEYLYERDLHDRFIRQFVDDELEERDFEPTTRGHAVYKRSGNPYGPKPPPTPPGPRPPPNPPGPPTPPSPPHTRLRKAATWSKRSGNPYGPKPPPTPPGPRPPPNPPGPPPPPSPPHTYRLKKAATW